MGVLFGILEAPEQPQQSIGVGHMLEAKLNGSFHQVLFLVSEYLELLHVHILLLHCFLCAAKSNC